MDDWIKKIQYAYTMEYYSATRKKEILPICSNMDLPREHYVKWN